MNTEETTGGDELPPGFGVVRARPQRKTEKTMLPVDYEPSKYSIICGRGKGSYQSDGNVNFRHLVKSNLERYKEAPGRLEKSFIVSEVLAMIRESCPVGAFVKYENGRWYDLDDTVCREKVGSLFRDFLHTEYKSSSKAKHARKVAEKSTPASPTKATKKTTKAKKDKPKEKPPTLAPTSPTLKKQPTPKPKLSPPPKPKPSPPPKPTVTAIPVVSKGPVAVPMPTLLPTRNLLLPPTAMQLGPIPQPFQQRPPQLHRQQPRRRQDPTGDPLLEDRRKFYDIDDLSLAKLE